MSAGPTTHQMQAWARRQMRACPNCGRKYIRPKSGPRESGGAWYRSERKRPDICWRCERALDPTPAIV